MSEIIPYPRLVLIGMNTVCNYKCSFCNNPRMVKHDSAIEQYLTEDMENLMKRSEIVDISGYGEIILSPNFKHFVDMLTKYGKKVSFSTNGFALVPELVDYINKSSVYLINVSLNSLNPTTYKSITGIDGLSKVLSNLEYIFSIQRNFKLNISMVLTGQTMYEAEQFVHYAHKHKADTLRLSALTTTITNYSEELLVKELDVYKDNVLKAKKLADELGVTIQIPSFDRAVSSEKMKGCKAPWYCVGVDANMNVTPCCFLGSMIMGNLKDGKQKFEDVWLGEKYTDLRGSILDGSMKYCKHCLEFG